MKHEPIQQPDHEAVYGDDLRALDAAKTSWAQTSIKERVQIVREIKDALMLVSEGWATTATRKKGIPSGSHLGGEEWISGPYAVMSYCNNLIHTLTHLERKTHLDVLPKRTLPTGQTAVRVTPHTIWDRLLLSGVHAEVWMQSGIGTEDLKQNSATAYDIPIAKRVGKVALILGAGNIASITPLDAFQKLFLENQVVLMKMNPVNDYLTEYLIAAMKPLIDRDALRIVRGDSAAGAFLCDQPIVEEIHITGASATHDAIVWGLGEEGRKNKAAGTPKNNRKITSELGAVSPTIVVPGPWSDADILFQAEHLATQKMHNSGFNCIALQNLVLPADWDQSNALLAETKKVIAKFTQRAAYYPKTNDRLTEFTAHAGDFDEVNRGEFGPACVVAGQTDADAEWLQNTEIFAPALAVQRLSGTDEETYLRAAIKWANENLYGTLGGNIIIHPATLKKIGKARFEEILADFRYGAIGVNAWTGVAFLTAGCPWGGFAGATMNDIQSGIGTVHNAFMLENTERCVVYAPFRPFPRSILSGSFSLLPRPPWFVTCKNQEKVGELMTKFQHRPSWLKLPGIFFNALRG